MPVKTRKPGKNTHTTVPMNPLAPDKFYVSGDPAGTTYRCTCCGKFYPTQASNFFASTSDLFVGNNGFTTICRECTKKYFAFLVKTFGGDEKAERKAAERIFQLFDLYYSDNLFDRAAETVNTNMPLCVSLINKTKLRAFQDEGYSYLDTMANRRNAVAMPEDSGIDPFSTEDEEPVDEEIQRLAEQWGPGYSPEEYRFLQKHYDELIAMTSGDDGVQDILCRDMATTKVFQNRALMADNGDLFAKLQKSYQDSARQANLVIRDSDKDSDEASFGRFIDMIENYCPAEYYKDKKLFDDFDGIAEYLRRFVLRPLKNFLTGSQDMDPEFSVTDEDAK